MDSKSEFPGTVFVKN